MESLASKWDMASIGYFWEAMMGSGIRGLDHG